jgi:hypothetical protein
MSVERRDDLAVILGVHDHGHMGVVLGRRPDHGGAADVDVLDRRGVIGAARDGFLERVEVHDQKVDGADAVGLHRRDVLGLVAQRQKPPCTFGCRVLTRPSIISGKPVTSATSVTVSPASRSVEAVPPVERSSTPLSARALAKSTSPVLSDTEMSAWRIGARAGAAGIGGQGPLAKARAGARGRVNGSGRGAPQAGACLPA